MKRIRILAVVVALLLSLTMLTGCNALKLEDVQSDPMKYVEDGLKLTFSSTPFASMYEEHENASLAIGLKGEAIDADGKLYFDETKKLALDLDATYKYADEELFFEGEELEQKINLSAYYADKQLAVKTEFLKELFGTDTLGINFGITKDEFKESALYDLLLSLTGMTEEDFDAALNDENSAKLREAFDKYLAKAEEISKNGYSTDVVEESVLIGEKEIKAVVVTVKLSEKLYDETFEAIEEFYREIFAIAEDTSAGEALSEDDIKAYFDEMVETMPELGMEYKYYLSAKSGAVVKVISEMSFASEVEGEAIDISVESETVYGANPEKLFLPEFTYKIKSGDEAIILDGKSSISDAKLLVEGALKVESEEPDEGAYNLEFAADGAFTLKLIGEEKEHDITGSLTSTENGIDFKADLTNVYDEDESKDVTEIALSLNFAEEVPALPEYKDIFDLTEDDLEPVLSSMGLLAPDYEAIMYEEILYYLGIDEDTLDAALAQYATYNYPSELDYMYALYADCAYIDLRDNYEVSEATLDALVQSVVDAGGTYYDLAVMLYDAYDIYAFGDFN